MAGKGAWIGVVSDTHGLLRPELLEAMEGAQAILHAGDIGRVEILEELNGIAPVTVVRGNTDFQSWADDIPNTQAIEISGHFVYMIHDISQLDIDLKAAGVSVLIHGHTHYPEITKNNGVLVLNPGSAGPVRGIKPVTCAKLYLDEIQPIAEIVPLPILSGLQ